MVTTSTASTASSAVVSVLELGIGGWAFGGRCGRHVLPELRVEFRWVALVSHSVSMAAGTAGVAPFAAEVA